MQAARASMTGADPDEECEEVVEVRSPIRGRVLRVPEQSERVVPAGATLLEVGDPSSLEIVAEILSTDAVRIRAGARVIIEEWGGDTALAGRVRTVEPSGFTKLSALGVEEQRVRVIVDPADRTIALGDGFRVETRIVVWESPRTLKVPLSALFRRGEEWSVFTVNDGRAYVRPVGIGHRSAFEAELLNGLVEGDSVVLHPTDQLSDGARVRLI
jgi:HlyD family secretion protein